MSNHTPFDLNQRARDEMRDEGFDPEFSPEALAQLSQIEHGSVALETEGEIRDLRHLLWSSIDNRESRDLDQIEVAEAYPNGNIRLLIGIADVDAVVPEFTPLDRHAQQNGMTVYSGVEIFPMLPEPLSTDRTSLLPNQDRLAVVVEMEIDHAGEIVRKEIYRAWTRNLAQLAYETTGAWLEGEAELPERAAAVPGMEAQLRLQDEAGQRLRIRRQQEGALEFETVEARPVVEQGRVTDLQVPRKNRARQMIENFMITANTSMAQFLEEQGVPAIQRVVRSPQRWPRIVAIAAEYGEQLPADPDPRALSRFLARRKEADPSRFIDLSLAIVKLLGPGEYAVVKSPLEHVGHFGLAAYSYTHSTAPNRRYADVLVQRSLKAVLNKTSAPYPEKTLTELAAHCTERENAARKVERFMRKAIAAVWLHDRIGEQFEAIVTGVNPKGTFVRVTHPPVEGRVMHGERSLDVGDKVTVRLIGTNPERGFIDFERVGGERSQAGS